MAAIFAYLSEVVSKDPVASLNTALAVWVIVEIKTIKARLSIIEGKKISNE